MSLRRCLCETFRLYPRSSRESQLSLLLIQAFYTQLHPSYTFPNVPLSCLLTILSFFRLRVITDRMATSYDSYSEADHPRTKPETKTVDSPRTSRRKITLICITLLLNVLMWSAIICLVTSLYQIISDPRDKTNITPVVLTLTSVCSTNLATKADID